MSRVCTRSPYSGFSVEFAEHREYSPGDDVRYVDWKVFGKTDTHTISSGSRKRPTSPATSCSIPANRWPIVRSGAAVSKLEYAEYVAAALAHLVVRQQDAVGLATFNNVGDTISAAVEPASSPQRDRARDGAHASPRRNGPGPNLSRPGRAHPQAGLVIILSDLFDDPAGLMAGLKHFRHRRHDVSVLQIIDPAEQDFPFDEPTRFRGLEGLAEQTAEPRVLRRAYSGNSRSFSAKCGLGAANCGWITRSFAPTGRSTWPSRAFLTRRMHAAGRT